MKKTTNSKIAKTAFVAVAMAMAISLYAKSKDDGVMKVTADNTYIVNTTTLCRDVKGFRGATPVEIYIKRNKIVKLVALPNSETPKFFAKVRNSLLPKWAGLKVKTAAAKDIDGVSGATYSSHAVKQNVAAGLRYYQSHK